jgi:hypothetical protein
LTTLRRKAAFIAFSLAEYSVAQVEPQSLENRLKIRLKLSKGSVYAANNTVRIHPGGSFMGNSGIDLGKSAESGSVSRDPSSVIQPILLAILFGADAEFAGENLGKLDPTAHSAFCCDFTHFHCGFDQQLFGQINS